MSQLDSSLRPKPESAIGYIPSQGSQQPVEVRCLEVLGAGRAAEARLVVATTADGQSETCVEKLFAPGILTRLIYRFCFQAAFAYQSNQDAILAAFYRRRVAWALCKALLPEVGVARPLYVRWDKQSKALVLASEWIRGRGIIPQPVDRRMIRRFLRNRTGRDQENDAPPPEEIQELLTVMQRMEQMFLDSGLVGTGWQVCRRAIVSTANLLRTPGGYVSIDLESGIPAMLVSTYVTTGIRLRSVPLFDDLDPVKLNRWLEENRNRLADRLDFKQLEQLEADARQLIEYTDRWKESEPAIFRRPMRLVTNRFRSLYRQRIMNSWSLQEIWDRDYEQAFRAKDQRLLSSGLYWLGWIPGTLGRFAQRYLSNQRVRSATSRWVSNRRFRKRAWQSYTGRLLRKWQAAGRLSEDRSKTTKISWIQFFGHRLLAASMPAKLHRFLVDSQIRQNWMVKIALLIVSPRFQMDYGRSIIKKRIHSWRRSERLTEKEEKTLLEQLDHPAIEEYLRGFGLHLGLKFLFPLILSLKAAGAAASLASGDPLYFLVMLMLLPLLRTIVTVWRKMATGRPWLDFRDALVVGLLPSVGSLAFPVQMYSTCSNLSMFLIRDFAAQVGRWLPIYGGKDSRTELACIKAANIVFEVMELWLFVLGNRRDGDSPVEGSTLGNSLIPFSSLDRLSGLSQPQVEMSSDMNSSQGEKTVAITNLVSKYYGNGRDAA